MAKVLDDSQVLYIEPNAIDETTTYSDEEGNMVYKTPSLEDMCIAVDLEVEIKGRTYTGSKEGDTSNITLTWQSNSAGESVNFMSGSKIYTNSSQTEYINSLTTRYTDIFLKDIEDSGISEMFGIKSIDIAYDHFMVPDVTIQFTDVRGVSLFAQEEMRHNLTQDGMSGTVNNDIEGSFFKCFFTFPYPKFTLKVKGFYGAMTSYELTCSDFRASFDSQTGNFNVTAKFIGYAFSFLNDVTVNTLVAAPYCEYVGAQYWKDNLNTRFKVVDKNGSEVAMPTLGQICHTFQNIQKEVDQQLSTDEGLAEAAENADMSDEDNAAIKKDNLKSLNDTYTNLMAMCKDSNPGGDHFSPNKEEGDVIIRYGNSFCYITEYDDDCAERIIKEFDKLNTEIKNHTKDSVELKNWNHTAQLVKYDDWTDIANDNKLKSGFITEQGLAKEVEKKANEIWKDDDKYYVAWQDKFDASTVYIYEDWGLGTIIDKAMSEVSTNKEDAKNRLRDKVMAEKLSSALQFTPTIENITKIVMAHFETYVHIIQSCVNTVLESGADRQAGKLGVDVENFHDTTINNSDNSNVLIAPFPAVSKVITQEGIEKREGAWIGEYPGFEETKLIEALVKAVEEVGKDINYASYEAELTEKAGQSGLLNPLSYLDLFTNYNDKSFGNVNVASPNSVFSSFAVRAFSIMGTQDPSKIYAETFGKLDAKNFFDQYGSTPNISALRDVLRSSTLTGEFLLNYFKGSGDSPEGKDKATPWKSSKNLISQVTKDGTCQLTSGLISGTCQAIPVRNWSFEQWAKDFNQKSGIVTNNLKPYTLNYTPKKSNGHYYDDGASSVIFAKYKPLQWLRKSLQSLTSESDVLGIFSDTAFDVEEINRQFTDTKFCKNISKKVWDYPNDSLEFDDDGGVKNASLLTLTFNDCFFREGYYALNSDVERASFFLNYLPSQSRRFVDELVDRDKPFFKYYHKFSILKMGAYLNTTTISKSGLRPSIYLYLVNNFKLWANTKFKAIHNAFALKFKTNKNCKDLISALKGVSGTIKRQAIINSYIDYKAFENAYTYTETSETTLGIPTIGGPIKEAIEDLFQIGFVCLMTKFNKKEYSNTISNGPFVSNSNLTSYFNGVISGLREVLDVSENDQSSSTEEVAEDTTVIDIKVGIYNYIKMLYDKWIASGNPISEYTMEKMFYDDDHTFHFIDSFYNNIGKSMYLNLGTLVDQVVKCQTQDGFTLLSLLSGLYTSNKFIFLCIQNFIDLSKRENMEKMFKPIPYIEMERPDNHPDFVALYAYEQSSKLDVEGSDYPDDSFYLNEKTTWPEMITSKQDTDYSIPAFGVSYGQQYQSYFTNIQVDMNTPIATEQSIKAKYLIAGGNVDGQNNGTRHVTVGQDLYSIYSNNSYSCTVTMLGCAWVQPMMYFVLQNVPMFRGSYLIYKVSHQITPGNMITTFTGARMAKVATRTVKQYLYGDFGDSTNGMSDEELREAGNANICNNCSWAYNNPDPSVTGTDFSAELTQKLINNLPTNAVNISTYDGGYYKNWTIQDALGAIAYQEFGGSTQDAIDQRIAVISCMYNWRGLKGKDAYKKSIFASGWRYFILGGETLSRLKKVSQNASNWQMAKNEVMKVFKNGPYSYIVGKKNYLDNSTITLEQVQKGLHTPGTSDAKNMQKLINDWGSVLYKLKPVNGYFHIITGDKGHPNGFVPPIEETKKETKKNDNSQLYSGFTASVQASLNASQYYKNATVTMEDMGSNWIRLTATGENANNAMFDCILQTYGDWFDKLSWGCNKSKVEGDSYGVHIHINKTPKSHEVYVYNKDSKTVIQLTKAEEVNTSLKASMIKYFTKHSVTTVPKAQAIFKSIVNMPSNIIKTVFELTPPQPSQITDCDSLLGNNNGSVTSGVWTTSNNPIIKAAIKMASWYLSSPINGRYSQSKEYACPLINNKKVRSDCSGFVSATLILAGKMPGNKVQSSSWFATTNDLTSVGFKKSSFINNAALQPGDIVAKKGHVFIAAGVGKAFDFGGNRTKEPVNIVNDKYTTIWRL